MHDFKKSVWSDESDMQNMIQGLWYDGDVLVESLDHASNVEHNVGIALL